MWLIWHGIIIYNRTQQSCMMQRPEQWQTKYPVFRGKKVCSGLSLISVKPQNWWNNCRCTESFAILIQASFSLIPNKMCKTVFVGVVKHFKLSLSPLNLFRPLLRCNSFLEMVKNWAGTKTRKQKQNFVYNLLPDVAICCPYRCEHVCLESHSKSTHKFVFLLFFLRQFCCYKLLQNSFMK